MQGGIPANGKMLLLRAKNRNSNRVSSAARRSQCLSMLAIAIALALATVRLRHIDCLNCNCSQPIEHKEGEAQRGATESEGPWLGHAQAHPAMPPGHPIPQFLSIIFSISLITSKPILCPSVMHQ
jgi:hypothetical protein